MKEPKYPIPDWVTRGKSVRQLIEELRTFEDQDREVRISLDDDKHYPISLVGKKGKRYAVLHCAEPYYRGAWQSFWARHMKSKKRSAKSTPKKAKRA